MRFCLERRIGLLVRERPGGSPVRSIRSFIPRVGGARRYGSYRCRSAVLEASPHLRAATWRMTSRVNDAVLKKRVCHGSNIVKKQQSGLWLFRQECDASSPDATEESESSSCNATDRAFAASVTDREVVEHGVRQTSPTSFGVAQNTVSAASRLIFRVLGGTNIPRCRCISHSPGVLIRPAGVPHDK